VDGLALAEDYTRRIGPYGAVMRKHNAPHSASSRRI